jgi:hypothetical protein
MTEIEKSTMQWRWAGLSTYIIIVLMDFLLIPLWYGLNRPQLIPLMEIVNSTHEVIVQMEILKLKTAQHSPFTLMGGGIFHLAFGAILTGSAFGLNK